MNSKTIQTKIIFLRQCVLGCTLIFIFPFALAQTQAPITGRMTDGTSNMAANNVARSAVVPGVIPVNAASPTAIQPLQINRPISASATNARSSPQMASAKTETTSQQMASNVASATTVPASVPIVKAAQAQQKSYEVGAITRALLAAQADNNHMGRQLLMLGSTATIAYKRYIDSFSHPIPEFFAKTIKDDSGSSGS